MDSIRISGEAKDALTILASLPDDAVNEIATLLIGTKFQLFPASEALRQMENVKNLEPEKAQTVTALLLSLWFSQSTRKRTKEDIAKEVTVEFGSTEEGKNLDPQQRELLRKHLEKLLDNPKLLNAQNASSLILDYERVFSVGRVLTDVRPVFEGTGSETIFGALVVHTLKLAYYKPNGNTDEFFVVMDDNDIAQLSDMLDRAKAKSQLLKKLLEEGKKLKYIEVA